MRLKYDHYCSIDIAVQSGFNSKSIFNALFKKFTGRTPLHLKKASSTELEREIRPKYHNFNLPGRG